MTAYLHGYSAEETARLVDQASVLEPWLYPSLPFRSPKRILEAGAGVGAQTALLEKYYPEAEICAVEIDALNYQALEQWAKLRGVEAVHGDILKLGAELGEFDAAYICWVLEHVSEPIAFLRAIRSRLKKGAVLCITEVVNSSLVLYPKPSSFFDNYYDLYNECQRLAGGEPNAGIHLGRWLLAAGFSDIEIQPILIHCDEREPAVKARIFRYFGTLLGSAEKEMNERGLVSADAGRKIAEEMDSYAMNPEGVFTYCALRAVVRV